MPYGTIRAQYRGRGQSARGSRRLLRYINLLTYLLTYGGPRCGKRSYANI